MLNNIYIIIAYDFGMSSQSEHSLYLPIKFFKASNPLLKIGAIVIGVEGK